MKAFTLAMAAMIAITVLAALSLQMMSMSAQDTYVERANVRR